MNLVPGILPVSHNPPQPFDILPSGLSRPPIVNAVHALPCLASHPSNPFLIQRLRVAIHQIMHRNDQIEIQEMEVSTEQKAEETIILGSHEILVSCVFLLPIQDGTLLPDTSHLYLFARLTKAMAMTRARKRPISNRLVHIST